MTRTDSRTGRFVLMTSHCAGMVDMVALPVWVGTLISAYKLDPQQAGGLVTLFLVAAVAASIVMAPQFNRLSGRLAASVGFAVSAVAFIGASLTSDFAALAALHLLGGFAAGTGLSFTHGTIGRSANPHRLFGMAGMALGVFAVFFLAATPKLVATFGGPMLFKVFATVMLVGALLAAWAFPVPDAESKQSQSTRESGMRLSPEVWCGVLGVSCIALVQAMMFSFVERIGMDREFGVEKVSAVLVIAGIVNIFPPGIAALLDKRLNARTVVITGPGLQALLALCLAFGTGYGVYAFGASILVSVMLFTHTFAFGILARLDITGRAVAATPAMVMIGSSIGPILGGTIVKFVGYGGLGIAALIVDVAAIVLFSRIYRTVGNSHQAAAAKSV